MEGSETKKRNMDKRRETSRFAARDRRGKETHVFNDLKDVVPVVEEPNATHLDRIALLRVSTAFCRFRQHITSVIGNGIDYEPDDYSNLWQEESLTECLDGFVLVLQNDGSILYTTESVSNYLGHTQTEMSGIFFDEFAHPDDYQEFKELVSLYLKCVIKETEVRSVVLRMKSIISPRGRTLNMKSAIYKPISFMIRGRCCSDGCVVILHGISLPAGIGSANAAATAIAKGSEALAGTFLTRHSCDMRITSISDRLNYLLKNELKTLIGTSFYDLVHPCDCQVISQAMKEMFTKGHVRTPYYRLLAANKSVAWMITEANTIKHTSKGQAGQYVICLHYLVGVQPENESFVNPSVSNEIRMLNLKKEPTDCGEYAGRQPEVIDADFVPVFSGGDYDRPLSPLVSSAGDCSRNYNKVYNWIPTDESNPTQETYHRQSPIGDPTLASAQVMAGPGTRPKPETDLSYSRNSGRCSDNAVFAENTHAYRSSSPSIIPHCGNQSVECDSASNTLSRIPTICLSDNNVMSSDGIQRSTGVYPFMPSAHSSGSTMPQSVINPPPYIQQEPQVSDHHKWEDLTGLAPYVPYEDEMNYPMDFLPDDLQEFLQDLPEWTPEQSFIPAGPKPAMSAVHQQSQCIEQFEVNGFESYDPSLNLNQQDMNQPALNSYWQESKPENWDQFSLTGIP